LRKVAYPPPHCLHSSTLCTANELNTFQKRVHRLKTLNIKYLPGTGAKVGQSEKGGWRRNGIGKAEEGRRRKFL
jgi:hypothetical protein